MKRSHNSYTLDKSLGHLAARYSRVLMRRINAEFLQHRIPITAEQYSLLIHLWDQNGLPQGVLTEKTAKDKTTITRLAAGLESRGLIVRLPSLIDARERMVFLSDKGNELMDQATDLVHGIHEEAQQGICEAELEACRKVLYRTCSNLHK
ncbi:MAG: MarR family transcriptional regulator [Geobacteraceae bacterium]|nr:MarR family transcriptional regulator [Geobacteraceae bacterium]